MSYILNKTNGSIIAIVADASIDITADLIFVGRNYAGYGEIQNENFLKLLENFSNTSAPSKPIEGQLWYNSNSKHINMYDSTNWKSLATLEVNSNNPINIVVPTTGDLWYDTTEQQLYVFNGLSYTLIGPPIGADSNAGWRGDFESADGQNKIYNTKAVIGDSVIATISNQEYTLNGGLSGQYTIYADGARLHKGINLTGANPNTGNSEAAGNYFWGTAAHALNANTATYALGFSTTLDTANKYNPVGFINTTTTSFTNGTISIDYGFTFNPSTNYVKATRFEGVATSALYADLAERYEADAVYEPGTVLIIGGEKEVTVTTTFADTRVAGIVSKNPAYMMNSEAGTNETHPYIALKGRVPCKVQGYINKGDLIVTSSTPGYGIAASNVFGGAIIGKALRSQSEGFGIIEVLVV
jgi:hypothetical protein